MLLFSLSLSSYLTNRASSRSRPVITCFTTTWASTTTWYHPKPYFSPFHLAVVSDDDSNMRLFRKFSMRRRLLILKCPSLSRQFEIIRCFNSSIVLILHSLFVTFSPLFDLNDDTLSQKKAHSCERDDHEKKKTRRRQSNQRVRKDIKIEEILSSPTSKSFSLRIFDFVNEENCV
jgi:hypothetical protein